MSELSYTLLTGEIAIRIFRYQAQGPLFQAFFIIPIPCSFFRSIRNLPFPSTMQYLEWSQIVSLMIDKCEGVLYGLRRLMSGLQPLLLSQRLWIYFLEPTWPLTNISHSRATRFNALSKPPRTPSTHVVHKHTSRQNIYTHKIIINNPKIGMQ